MPFDGNVGFLRPIFHASASMLWQTARFQIDLNRPRVMGIVNVTPDSFSDGGRYCTVTNACGRCDQLIAEGADILDIGGESTRPGAVRPSVAEELNRLLPVVRYAVQLGVPISVDTSQPEVMQAVLGEGADIINDVRALTAEGALGVIARHGSAGVCLMHMQGDPTTMQINPQYLDVIAEIRGFLRDRVFATQVEGIDATRVVIDPGYGFGKSLEHNLILFSRQSELLDIGRPLLVGLSRKGMLGAVTGRPLAERVHASVTAALAAVARGARIVRVHDVAATVDALTVWRAAGLDKNFVW